MQHNNHLKRSIVFLIISILILSLYRVIPFRSPGFAPQLALSLFAGFLFSTNRKIMFVIPLVSLFLSDCIYQGLYALGTTSIVGFYGYEQFINYILIASVALFGRVNKMPSQLHWLSKGALGATFYYVLSNTIVWISFGGYSRPHTFSGYVQCMTDAVPFYINSLFATAVFSLILLWSYNKINSFSKQEIA